MIKESDRQWRVDKDFAPGVTKVQAKNRSRNAMMRELPLSLRGVSAIHAMDLQIASNSRTRRRAGNG